MARETNTKAKPTEEEILAYDNVPVAVACAYINMSCPTMYRALQDERAPFGFASHNPDGQWTYNISPGALVKYKRGELPLWRLGEVQQVAVEGIERIIDIRIEAARAAINAVFSTDFTRGLSGGSASDLSNG